MEMMEEIVTDFSFGRVVIATGAFIWLSLALGNRLVGVLQLQVLTEEQRTTFDSARREIQIKVGSGKITLNNA
jgi:hypothetical protein